MAIKVCVCFLRSNWFFEKQLVSSLSPVTESPQIPGKDQGSSSHRLLLWDSAKRKNELVYGSHFNASKTSQNAKQMHLSVATTEQQTFLGWEFV